MVYTLFSLMFKVFFVAAAAYLLRRRGALTAQDQKSVTNVLMRLSLIHISEPTRPY